MTRIFISYSRVDKNITKTLAELLSQSFDDVWYDTAKLVGGDEWWAKILDEIVNCDHFIYLLSPEAVASEWCQKELAEALESKKHIIPVRVRDRTKTDGELGKLHVIDMFDEVTTDGLNKIYAAIVRTFDSKSTIVPGEKHRISDLRLLGELWQYIHSEFMEVFTVQLASDYLDEEIHDKIIIYTYIRGFPEYQFIDSELEREFEIFDEGLDRLGIGIFRNLVRDQSDEKRPVSAIKSANLEGITLEDESQIKARYQDEVEERSYKIRELHKDLVKRIKLVYPEFAFRVEE